MSLYAIIVKYSYILVCFEFITYAFLSACILANLIGYSNGFIYNLNFFLKFVLILGVSIFSVFVLLLFYFLVDASILYVLFMLQYILGLNFIKLDLYLRFIYHVVIMIKLIFYWYEHFTLKNKILIFYLKFFLILFIILYFYVFFFS